MGTCFYLFREDNGTAYDLGKAYGWGPAFGDAYADGMAHEVPMFLRPEDAETFGDLLELELVTKEWWTPAEIADLPGYFRHVAADIAAWSDGHPFVCVSEHDWRIERAYEHDDYSSDRRWLTGSRFESWERVHSAIASST